MTTMGTPHDHRTMRSPFSEYFIIQTDSIRQSAPIVLRPLAVASSDFDSPETLTLFRMGQRLIKSKDPDVVADDKFDRPHQDVMGYVE